MHTCDKIEESKEMIITKVRIVVISKKGELCAGRSAGELLGCWQCSIS